MGDDRFIKAIIYIAAAAWTAVLFINHEPLKPALLTPLSTVVTVVVWIALFFDLWLWKLPVLHGWFVKRPVIDGTWKVAFRSDYINPETGAATPPLEGYMVIKQTHSKLTMRLLTAESTSELVGNEIVCATDGSYCVSGVYSNEPRLEVRHRSPIHYGGIRLKVIEQPAQQLIGHYWTDRKTAGEIELTQRRSKRFQTFQAAKDYYDKQPVTA